MKIVFSSTDLCRYKCTQALEVKVSDFGTARVFGNDGEASATLGNMVSGTC